MVYNQGTTPRQRLAQKERNPILKPTILKTTVMENVNQKSVLRVLKQRYPTIARELMPQPELTDLTQIHGILSRFAREKKEAILNIRKNRDDSMLLFLAVVIQAYDPACFVDERKKLKSGLRAEITKSLDCNKTWVSHLLRIVRTRMRVHRPFKTEVAYLYQTVIKGHHASNTNRTQQNRS